MLKQDCLQIGTIVKNHGINGELIIELKNPLFIENIKESILVNIDGLLVPFFILTIKQTSNIRIRVKFDWLNSEQKAKKLISSSIYLPESELSLNKTSFTESPKLLEEFIVIDTNDGEIGKITQIIENPNNPIIIVKQGRSEILIPLHEDLIQHIDTNKKQITITCPKGLIDLYVNN